MKVEKEELFKALSKVQPGLSDKAIIEQTDHFIFDQDYVRTYNDEIAISYPFKSGFCTAVKADEFFKLISKTEDKKIDLEIKDNFLVMSGKDLGRARMIMASEVKCPTVEIKARRWFQLPKNFPEAIRFASFSADWNMLQKELTCLWIKDQYVISSDRFRATKYEMDSKLPEFLLPATIAQKLCKYTPTYYIVEAEGAWIHFRNTEGIIFSSRVIEGEYPYQEEVWATFTLKGDIVKIPEGLKEAVDRAKIFTQGMVRGDSDLIQLKVDKSGKLTCRGEGTLGDVEKEFAIDYKKKDFEIKAPPEALIEILTYIKEMRVSNDKLYFSGPNFEHVISLI